MGIQKDWDRWTEQDLQRKKVRKRTTPNDEEENYMTGASAKS
jgi:hypothetical protein